MAISFDAVIARVDDLQRAHPVLGFPVGVIKKVGDDKGNQLAALITYYAFFSLFPLLMAAFTIFGFVLDDNPELRHRLAETIQERLPMPGVSAESITGSGFALAVGLGLSLWSGLRVTQVAQDALNTIWDVPRHQQPNFLVKRLQGLLVLVVLGGGIVAATIASSLTHAIGLGSGVMSLAGSVAINGALVCVLMRVLVEDKIAWMSLKWAAVVGGVGWTALQLVGGWYTTRLIDNANQTYGTFAVVIGLLSWILLQVQVFLYAAEVASVASRRLWPRSLDPNRPTEADHRVVAAIFARSNPLSVADDVEGDGDESAGGDDGSDDAAGITAEPSDHEAHDASSSRE